MSRTLSAIFLDRLDGPLGERMRSSRGLERALVDLVATARAAWPKLWLPDEVFVAFVAERIASDQTPESAEEALEQILPAALFLTCACSHGDARAIATLEEAFFPDIDQALARMNLTSARIQDVKQALREQLFVARPGAQAKIGDYRGRGELAAWLRVSAVRLALKAIKRDQRELPTDDRILQSTATASDPELQQIGQERRAAFDRAFQDALRSLSRQERLLLRQYYLDGLTLAQLGALHHLHHATIARRLEKLCGALLARTKRLLARARLSPHERDSLVRWARSQFDGTMRRLLAS